MAEFHLGAGLQLAVDATQSVPTCPVCGSGSRRQVHAGLVDQVFGIAPGNWTLFSCEQCDTAWLDPRLKDDSISLAYEGYFTHSPPMKRVIVRRKGFVRRVLHDAVNDYLASRFRVGKGSGYAGWMLYLIPPLRATCDAMCRHLPPSKPGGKLLDVGCGNGAFLSIAREMGWEAEGLDFDPGAVEQARSLGFHVTQGGVEALSGHSRSYDVITSSHVLEHVPDPAPHLRQLFALLKPGGLLWLQTPNIKSLGARLYGRHWRGLEPPRHLVLFNNRSLRKCLADAGFVDIRDKPEGGQVILVFRVSEAIKRGLPLEEAGRDKSRLPIEILAELAEWFRPSSREFLTILCRKPGA